LANKKNNQRKYEIILRKKKFFFYTILLNVVKFLGARIVIVKFDLNDGSSKQGKA
jgi:hypothetical protein